MGGTGKAAANTSSLSISRVEAEGLEVVAEVGDGAGAGLRGGVGVWLIMDFGFEWSSSDCLVSD